MRPLPTDTDPFPHVLRWNRFDRQGKRCEIIGVRNTIGNVQVRFEDGFTAIVSRKALRRTPRKDKLLDENRGESRLAENVQ
jgi:hypothetical protein